MVNGYRYFVSYLVSNDVIIQDLQMSKPDAEVSCQSMGLRLISINSKAEQNQIELLINITSDGGQYNLSTSRQEYWTSGNCSTPDVSSCRWGDGRSFTYTNWMNNLDDTRSGVTLDPNPNNKWRRRSPNTRTVWFLCDDGTFGLTPSSTTPPTSTTTTQKITSMTTTDDPNPRGGGGSGYDKDRHN